MYMPLVIYTIPNWGYRLVYKNIEVSPFNKNFDCISGALEKLKGVRIKARNRKAVKIRKPQKKGC